MNKEQLSRHIGNIDDLLIEQAGQIPNYDADQTRHWSGTWSGRQP